MRITEQTVGDSLFYQQEAVQNARDAEVDIRERLEGEGNMRVSPMTPYQWT
jgi:hypothetical protein